MEISTQHKKDVLVDCPHKKCKAWAGENCKNLPENIVHLGRRIRALLRERKFNGVR